MTIGLRIATIFIPLFLAAAAVSGIIHYKLEHQELLWGLREEAAGLSLSLSAHLENLEPSFNEETRIEALKKVFEWGTAKRIFLLNQQDPGRSFEILPDGRLQSASLTPLLSPPGEGETRQEDFGNERLISWSRISDAAPYYLGVATDKSFLAIRSMELRQQVLLGSLIVGCLAVLLVAHLTTTLRKRIKALEHYIRRPEGGSQEASFIAEVNELNDTFRTMNSLLSETLQPEAESISLSAGEPGQELAVAYNEKFLTPLQQRIKLTDNSFDLKIWLNDEADKQHAYAMLETDQSVEIVLARLTETSGDSLRLRSAMQTCIEAFLANSKSAAVCAENAGAVFSGATLYAVSLRKDKPLGQNSLSSSVALRVHFDCAERPQTILLHTLGPEVGSKLSEYMRIPRPSSPGALAAEINSVVHNGDTGVLVLMGAST